MNNLNEEFDILKEKATKRGRCEKRIIEFVVVILVVILIVAIPFFMFGWIFHGFDILSHIIQTESRDNKINSIISRGNYDVKTSLIKAKVISQWSIRKRYWTKYKNLENNEFFILDNNDLRL